MHYPKISDEFNYGGSASLNMTIVSRSMSWSILVFLGPFKVTKFGTNVWLHMFINISSEVYHNHKEIFGEMFKRFPTYHIETLL